MSRLIAAIALACALVSFASVSDAKPVQRSDIITCDKQGCHGETIINKTVRSREAGNDAVILGGRPSGCPRRYCGCGVSLKVFGRIIPELNLAANWIRKFPRTSPAAGMVAARRGHVFYINSYNGDGTALAYDPNSGGGKTRVHQRSLAGYTVVDPHGSRMASQ